ncbi:hypothetical protein [Deminuibacter soli]|uniref:Uncharacterized protein n=1 Tax=Deminuibacter soli TaxID=2291815 RepID=A0A3E1NHE7_9BACT|nr:hypothetical protein [Deminuibacter soli]RFM27274.1 hypothetical protein DXN05_14675 [Deminuibacter soli]
MKRTLLFACCLLLFACVHAQLTGSPQITAAGNLGQYLSKSIANEVDARKAKEGGPLLEFNNAENTIGTRFLFNTWVQGDSVINNQGAYINTTGFAFNFDKVSGNLIASQDKINIMAVVPDGISSFILQYMNRNFVFEHVKQIDASHFFLALAKSEHKYSLYKLFATKFIASNYHDDGIMQSGKKENEYKEESSFYLLNKTTGAVTPLPLKARAIKAAMDADKDKVNKYFHDHSEEEVDENFITGLVNNING